jgi:hypothetical protein
VAHQRHRCDSAADEGTISSIEVDPVLTRFLGFNVTSGTTGTRTDTLSKVNAVTTSFGATTEFTTEIKLFLAKVGVKAGFSVQTTKTGTDTESTSMAWSFSQPGYYGRSRAPAASKASTRT